MADEEEYDYMSDNFLSKITQVAQVNLRRKHFLHGFESGRKFANHLITYVYIIYTKKLEPEFLGSTPTSTTSFWILRIRIGLEVPAPKHWFIMPPLIILKSKQTGQIKVVIGYSENKLQPVRGTQIL